MTIINSVTLDRELLTTNDSLLDLFYLVGNSRENPKNVIPSFSRLYSTDKESALSVMLYSRDIKNGLGEREVFRKMLKFVAIQDPKFVSKIFDMIPKFGRYDDLLCLLGTSVEPKLINYIKTTLTGRPTLEKGLLAKWLPSFNCSNNEKKTLAKYIMKKLGMKEAEYRKMLSKYRSTCVIENKINNLDFTFNYEDVPSLAMQKYEDLFKKYDAVRFDEYLKKVAADKANFATDTLTPYDVYKTFISNPNRRNSDVMNLANLKWEGLKESMKYDMKDTLVIAFTPYCRQDNSQDKVYALSILASECVEGKLGSRIICMRNNDCSTVYDFRKSSFAEKAIALNGDWYNKIFNLVNSQNLLKVLKTALMDGENIIPLKNILVVGNSSAKEFLKMKEELDDALNDICSLFHYNDLNYAYLSVVNDNLRYPFNKDSKWLMISGSDKNAVKYFFKNKSFNTLEYVELVLSRYRNIVKKLMDK